MTLIKQTSNTWQILAILRFVLAWIVFSGHVFFFAVPNTFFAIGGRFGSFAAVIGFLTVSGYSIAHSIEHRQKGFYARRLLRIYPLYVFAIVFSVLPFLSGSSVLSTGRQTFAHPTLSNIFANLFFLQNFFVHPVSSNGVVWSLAVEVACYALTPFFRKTSTPWLLAIAGISAAAFVAYSGLNLAYYTDLLYGLPLLFLGWAWIAGFLFYRHKNHALAGPALIFLCVALLNINEKFSSRLSFLTIAATTSLIVAAPYISLPRRLLKPMEFLGDLSYPLYILHLPTLLLAWNNFHIRNLWLLTACVLFVSTGALVADSFLKKLFKRKAGRTGSVLEFPALDAANDVPPPIPVSS